MRRSAVLPVVPVLCAVLAGCAHDGEERQLDEMMATIDEVQKDRDKAEADMMASSVADTRMAERPERKPASALAPTPVVPIGNGDQLAQDEGEAADTEDPTPRPTIHIVGAPRMGRNGWRDDQVESSNVDDAQPPSRAERARSRGQARVRGGARARRARASTTARSTRWPRSS